MIALIACFKTDGGMFCCYFWSVREEREGKVGFWSFRWNEMSRILCLLVQCFGIRGMNAIFNVVCHSSAYSEVLAVDTAKEGPWLKLF